MFSLRDYILKMLDGSIGKELDYKIRENALGWYQKGVLVQADLEAIDQLLDAQNKLEEKETAEDDTEEETQKNLICAEPLP